MPGTILIVDDSTTIRSQIKSVLERDGTFDRFLEASDGLTAFKVLVDQRPDMVLCDLVMPMFDGTKFLTMYASRADVRQIPVIMLTGEDDPIRKVEVLEKGASDYVTKPFHDKELLARVRVHFRIKLLQDELRAANMQLEALATTDPLTGLNNRRNLERLLEDEIRRTMRYRTPVSVVMVDVDHFKHVNDTYGHLAGDEVLRNLAKTFTSRVRATDTVARYGGEEIVLVLPHTDLPKGVHVAEQLRVAFADVVHTFGAVSFQKTASFGVASFDIQPKPVTAAQLIQRADTALYRAKQEGRNRVVAWEPSMTSHRDRDPSSH